MSSFKLPKFTLRYDADTRCTLTAVHRLGRLSLLPFVGRKNKYPPCGWVTVDKWRWVNVWPVAAYRCTQKLKSGVWPASFWPPCAGIQVTWVNSCNGVVADDSTLNILLVTLILFFVYFLNCCTICRVTVNVTGSKSAEEVELKVTMLFSFRPSVVTLSK